MLKGTSCCWVPSVVSDSVRPTDGSPPGCPVPGILQARTLEWVAISFSNAWKWKVKVKSLSCVWLLATPWTAAYQAPLSMGFSRQEYWSGLPLPSPRNFLGWWKCSIPWLGYWDVYYMGIYIFQNSLNFILKSIEFVVCTSQIKKKKRLQNKFYLKLLGTSLVVQQ